MMSEAERIKREQMLQEAIKKRLQFGQGDLPHGAYSYDPNQPVPMAGYPNRPGAYSPSQLYQTLLKSGIPKEEARQKTFNMMQENNAAINEELPDQTEKLFPMEGEF
jgi:hypothetical protein